VILVRVPKSQTSSEDSPFNQTTNILCVMLSSLLLTVVNIKQIITVLKYTNF